MCEWAVRGQGRGGRSSREEDVEEEQISGGDGFDSDTRHGRHALILGMKPEP